MHNSIANEKRLRCTGRLVAHRRSVTVDDWIYDTHDKRRQVRKQVRLERKGWNIVLDGENVICNRTLYFVKALGECDLNNVIKPLGFPHPAWVWAHNLIVRGDLEKTAPYSRRVRYNT